MLCILLTALLILRTAQAQFQYFVTRPGQQSVAFKVLTNTNSSALSPGYIFLSPYILGGAYFGPHIYDLNGDLVWDGQYAAHAAVNDFHVAGYLGDKQDHFVFNDGNGFGHTQGTVRFFDNTYTQVGPDHGKVGMLAPPDEHESNVPIGQGSTTFIQDVYNPVQMNLSAYGGPNLGYVYSGCFQEVSLTNGSVLFTWCSAKHVPLDDTYVYLAGSSNYSNILSGSGTQGSPWDYFHINAIAKDEEGNYLVSARHTSALYKIAGRHSKTPGSIIWTMGGKANDFTMNPASFNFSNQHNCRLHGAGAANGTVISIFDNGSDGNGLRSAPASSGMIIHVDETNRIATLTNQYVQPQYLSAGSQGSVQTLPNGNVFIGWGQLPFVSEHTAAGHVLFYGQFGAPNLGFTSYRGYKFAWDGRPSTAPDVLPYSQTCANSSTKFVYASWNGATAVAHWQVFTGASAAGPWTQRGGSFARTGYETRMAVRYPGFEAYALVKAFDAAGALLGASAATPFFVPLPQFRRCDARSCGVHFVYNAGNSTAGTC